MTDLVLRCATYEDLLKVPDHLVAELIDGELYTSPRLAPRHSNVMTLLGSDLNVRFQRGRGGPGGWWILDMLQLRLAAESLVPDIVGWRRERLPNLPDTATIDVAPDWVCEVQSPSTALFDRVKKLPVYAGQGVQHVWLVDPAVRTLEVLRLENRRWILLGNYSDDDIVRAEPFEAVQIELGALWIDGPAS
ncbi:MAG TPA: Uma2 family endonuclease [Thermoanaerobaculia bacterium]|nr:Uma2 family endonuclease [Thermoanaerobaculia bacterium]